MPWTVRQKNGPCGEVGVSGGSTVFRKRCLGERSSKKKTD